jgi:hypothetical protein
MMFGILWWDFLRWFVEYSGIFVSFSQTCLADADRWGGWFIPDRVESEHIGHADQYRVTRDIPLPYAFDNGTPHDNTDDENHEMNDATAGAVAGVHAES